MPGTPYVQVRMALYSALGTTVVGFYPLFGQVVALFQGPHGKEELLDVVPWVGSPLSLRNLYSVARMAMYQASRLVPAPAWAKADNKRPVTVRSVCDTLSCANLGIMPSCAAPAPAPAGVLYSGVWVSDCR